VKGIGRTRDPLRLKVDNSHYLGEKAYMMLRDAILNGEFEPGEWISERQLSERMGVSTSPVKHALKRLEYDGLVINVPRKGRKVANFSAAIEEVCLIRAALEGVGARLAADKATENDIERLNECVGLMEELTMENRPTELMEVNAEFHKRIRQIARNNYLSQLVETLRVYDEKVRYKAISEPEEARRGLEEHRRIFEAIKNKDGSTAEHEMNKHIGRSAQFVLTKMRKR
jgi:DNA-binding GntR family transcriptional regulator